MSQQQLAARQRVAKERAKRIAAALKNRDELQKNREQRAKTACQPAKEARASTTDPEARNMKFANGGYEPGYNVQFATDVESQIIVVSKLTNRADGSNLDQQQQRYGKNARNLVAASFDDRTDAGVSPGEARPPPPPPPLAPPPPRIHTHNPRNTRPR